MTIAYPEFFEELLQRDRSLRAGVDEMVVAFDGWLNSSRLPFFTDYTDHGIDHLNCVMETADHLIADGARQVFTPSDAAVLIAAILLHDSAMHLSEAGFYSLIRGGASNWIAPGFDDRPWSVLWDEFLFSSKRWDERRLRNVLGETPDGELRAAVRDPFIDYHNLSDADRKLIGEFIRQHHPRMAHEFACYGVPGRKLVKLGMLRDDLRNLSGLVARSHGLPIRACLEHLQDRYHRREYDGVHAVYLMTLLRISDYLQIQSSRAPSIVFQYRHIPSKFSEQEWKAHNAISNITHTHDDPESIEIQAHPQDVHTYLRLKEWLSGIQTELDASWAVLGETYGSQPKLSRLGLILRRVRSNLDHIDAFSRQVNYVPERIELTVARPDLLKLLVGPLYDNIPSIGIRELVQNAVDAVRERQLLQDKYPELRDVHLIDQENDVEIWLGSPDKNGKAWLTVSDRGTGMSVEIIRDYFLTAGATFRSSDAWKREFETDDSPQSQVLRSGRFGVGVLAGFLLGTRMEVTTRYIRSEMGIRFSTTLELDAIELRDDPTAKVGTVIRIHVSSKIRQNLVESSGRVAVPRAFDWFVYDHPSVARFNGKQRTQLDPKFSIPPPDSNRPSSFRQLRGSHAYSVYWTYQPLPNLSVNGLFITESSVRAGFSRRGSTAYSYVYSGSDGGVSFSISHPKICVQDPDGSFPLNLRRSDVTEREYPFQSALVTDIVDDFLAYILVRCPQHLSNEIWKTLQQHPGVHLSPSSIEGKMFKTHWSPFVICKAGIALNSPRLIAAFQSPSVFLFSRSIPINIIKELRHSRSICAFDRLTENEPTRNRWSGKALSSHTRFLAMLEIASMLRRDSQNAVKLFGTKQVAGVRLLLPNHIARRVVDPDLWIAEAHRDWEKKTKKDKSSGIYSYGYYGMEKKEIQPFIYGICEQLKIEKTIGNHSFLATQDCPESLVMSETLQKKAYFLEACLTPSGADDVPGRPHPITERWEKIIRQPIIPFDLAARSRELKHAFEALEQFIVSHDFMRRNNLLH